MIHDLWLVLQELRRPMPCSAEECLTQYAHAIAGHNDGANHDGAKADWDDESPELEACLARCRRRQKRQKV